MDRAQRGQQQLGVFFDVDPHVAGPDCAVQLAGVQQLRQPRGRLAHHPARGPPWQRAFRQSFAGAFALQFFDRGEFELAEIDQMIHSRQIGMYRLGEFANLIDDDRPPLGILYCRAGMERQCHAHSRRRMNGTKSSLQPAAAEAIVNRVFAIDERPGVTGEQHFGLILAQNSLRDQPLRQRGGVSLRVGPFYLAELLLQLGHRTGRRQPTGDQQFPEIGDGDRHVCEAVTIYGDIWRLLLTPTSSVRPRLVRHLQFNAGDRRLAKDQTANATSGPVD